MSSANVSFLQRADGKILALSRIMGIIAIIVLVAMMFFTVLDVTLRAFFNRPIPGDVEVIELSMVCAGFFGLAWCAMRGMHIKVDLLVSFLPKPIQMLMDAFNYVLGFGICAVFAWQSFTEGAANRAMHSISSILHIPLFPFYWLMGIGFGVLCLAILMLLARSIAEVLKL